MTNLYYAYGSNMLSSRMIDRCPSAENPQAFSLADHRLIINGRGVATVVPVDGAQTIGVLWEISDEDMLRLDRFEGVRKGIYARRPTRIFAIAPDAKEKCVWGWTYFAADETIGSPRPGYLEMLLQGAREFGLSTGYIDAMSALA